MPSSPSKPLRGLISPRGGSSRSSLRIPGGGPSVAQAISGNLGPFKKDRKFVKPSRLVKQTAILGLTRIRL